MIIIDGSHMLHRSCSIPQILDMNVDGLITGPTYVFLNSLSKCISLFNEFPIIVFDRGLSKRRVELNPNYKNTKTIAMAMETGNVPEWIKIKEEHRKVYRTQKDFAMEGLKYLGLPVLDIDGWEGDDLMYYLAKNCDCSVIVTEDNDMLLMLDYVDVYMPIKKHYFVLKKGDPSRLPDGFPRTIPVKSVQEKFECDS